MNYFKFIFFVALVYWGLYLVLTVLRILKINDNLTIFNNMVIH